MHREDSQQVNCPVRAWTNPQTSPSSVHPLNKRKLNNCSITANRNRNSEDSARLCKIQKIQKILESQLNGTQEKEQQVR